MRPGHEHVLAHRRARQLRAHALVGERRREHVVGASRPPARSRAPAPCRSPAPAARRVACASAAGSRRGHAGRGRRRSACPRTSHSSLATCGTNGARSSRIVSIASRSVAGCAGLRRRRRRRDQLHHRRDRGVEVQALDRRRRSRAGSCGGSGGAASRSASVPRRRRRVPGAASRGATRVHEPPEPAEEAAHPLDALIAPVEIALGRRREQAEEPRGVRPVALDERVGVDDVALRLAHLGAVLDDHPLGQQAAERLVERRGSRDRAAPW